MKSMCHPSEERLQINNEIFNFPNLPFDDTIAGDTDVNDACVVSFQIGVNQMFSTNDSAVSKGHG